jgi:DNA-binding NarL/FixJ family response regulator
VPVAHPRVLIVEDDASVAGTIARLVPSPFIPVGPAATVADALALAESEGPAIILLDLLLRNGENAWLSWHEIRGRFPGAKVAILTGYPELAPVLLARDLGAAGYFVKDDAPGLIVLREAIPAMHANTIWLSETADRLLREGRKRGRQAEWVTRMPLLRDVPAHHPERETQLRLRAALQASPERLVYALGVLQGLSYQEIAESYGCTERAVRTCLDRMFGRVAIHSREQLTRLMAVLFW